MRFKGVIFLGLTSKLLCGLACTVISLSGITCENVSISAELDCNELEEISEDIEEPIEEEVKKQISFIKPISGGVITSYFGMRRGRQHNGIDIADQINTKIYASEEGEVIFAGYSGSYGNLVKIKHSDNYETYYAHCNSIVVSVGEKVQQGQYIANMGMTGNATGSHIHFEIRLNGCPINPYEYIY